MHEDFDRCCRVVRSRDPRFDGWFVTAVLTTRIYCRPSCPARTPRPQNMRFYPTVAAAQRDGFRACKRCRPDATPGSPEWNLRGDVVGRAMRLIGDGVVDREGVTGLASRLGYSTRQVERLLLAEVGAGPLALARAQRAQTARVLIETTSLPFAEVAFAAGFASVRQFNATVRQVFATSPTTLRERAQRNPMGTPGTLTLRLPVRTPFDGHALLERLSLTAVPGCEEVRDGTYRRTMRLAGGHSIVALTPLDGHVRGELILDDVRDLPAAIARCRRLLDLDADPGAVGDALGADPDLGPLVRRRPGRRIPRTVDEHELAMRVVVSQQVSLKAARVHAGALVTATGTPIDDPFGSLTHVFPSSETVASSDLSTLRLPAARRRCLENLAASLAEGDVVLDPGSDWEQARAQLATVGGVGDWTREMIALRGLGDPDAFPATDAVVRRAAHQLGLPTSPADLIDHARRWRPWRAYATQYLWSATS